MDKGQLTAICIKAIKYNYELLVQNSEFGPEMLLRHGVEIIYHQTYHTS
jgi:hypothetical protein